MSEWQPIETAPQDGTRILLCDDRCKPFPTLLGRWCHGAWWSDATNSGASIVWSDATHWMPLPAPPNKS